MRRYRTDRRNERAKVCSRSRVEATERGSSRGGERSMKAAIFNGPGEIELGERPDPKIQEPTDAVVRVVLGCVFGSDLWYYRGLSPHALGQIGHEFIGVVEEVGSDVHTIKKGDFVIAPFTYCDGTCANCRAGWPSNCLHGGSFGNHGIDGGQGEAVRAPFADATLVKVPGSGHSEETMRSLLTLSDVMCTGYHAAVSAGVKQGDVVAVVGDGAVGLCAIIGDIGVTHDVVVPIETVIFRNIGLRGGVSPVRRYIPELLEDVLEGNIHPGLVFDFKTDLNGITEVYVVMDERRAIKSLVQVGTI